jgi:quinol monooxygenase YgiN
MTPSDEARSIEFIAEWLGTVADAAAEGEVTLELEFDDGRYLVAEEWPSREAWLEHAQHRHAIEAMVAEDRKARSQGQH